MNQVTFGLMMLCIALVSAAGACFLVIRVTRLNMRHPQHPLLFGLALGYALLALLVPGVRVLHLPEFLDIALFMAMLFGMPVLGVVITVIGTAAFLKSRTAMFAFTGFMGLAALVGFWVNITTNLLWPYRIF